MHSGILLVAIVIIEARGSGGQDQILEGRTCGRNNAYEIKNEFGFSFSLFLLRRNEDKDISHISGINYVIIVKIITST